MKAKHYGLLLAVLSPFFSSIATILQSGASKLLTPLLVVSVGSLLGSIIILFYLLLSKNLPKWERIKKSRKDLALLTILRPILGAVVFVYALSITTGIKAIFFTKAEPYFVLFWFWLLESGRVRKEHLLLLGIHIIGAIFLSTGGVWDFGATQLGDLLVILAMGLFSLSYIYGGRVSRELGAKQANAISMMIGGIVILPLAIFFSPLFAWNIFSIGWAYLLGFVILFNVIGLTMWFASLKTVKGWMVSALRAIGPIAGAPFAWLLFGEILTPLQIIGALIVVSTSVIIAREHLKR